MKRRMLEERTFLMPNANNHRVGDEILIGIFCPNDKAIPVGTTEFYFLAMSRDKARARRAAIDEYFRELGFTETLPQRTVRLKNGYVIPMYRGWYVDLIKKTYRKVEHKFGTDPVITVPSVLKEYIQKHPGLISSYSYGI